MNSPVSKDPETGRFHSANEFPVRLHEGRPKTLSLPSININEHGHNNNNSEGTSPTANSRPRRWESDFLENILRNPKLCRGFRDFTKEQHCEENLIFWLEVERFRHLFTSKNSSLQIDEESLRIYVKYFVKDSPFELNVNYQMRKELENKLNAPDAQMFNKLQEAVFTLMAMDTYPKFMKSDLYHAIQIEINADKNKKRPTSKQGNTKRTYNTLTKNKDWRKGKDDDDILFEEYMNELGKQETNEVDNSGSGLVYHVHIITDKNVWKLIEFDPEITIAQAIKKIAQKVRIPEEDSSMYCLAIPSKSTQYNVRASIISSTTDLNDTILENERKLSSYHLKGGAKAHLGSMIFGQNLSETDGIGEIKAINLRGEKQNFHVDFNEPAQKILSFVCSRNNYKDKNNFYLTVGGVELDLAKSLRAQGIQAFAELHLKKRSSFRIQVKEFKQRLKAAAHVVEEVEPEAGQPQPPSNRLSQSPRVKRRTPTAASNRIFGQALRATLMKEHGAIPRIIESALIFLTNWLASKQSNGVVENLFDNQDAHAAEVAQRKNMIDRGGPLDFTTTDPHVVASLMKLYVDSLPEPLLAYPLYYRFVGLTPSEISELTPIYNIMDELPTENSVLVNRLVLFLHDYAKVLAAQEGPSPWESFGKIFASAFLRPPVSQEVRRERQIPADLLGDSGETPIADLASDSSFPINEEQLDPIEPAIHIVTALIQHPPWKQQSESPVVGEAKAPYLHYLRALFNYESQQQEELSFAKGDVIGVITEDESGWWFGSLVNDSGGKAGYFPVNYFEFLESLEEGTEQAPQSESHNQFTGMFPNLSEAEIKEAMVYSDWNLERALHLLHMKVNKRDNADAPEDEEYARFVQYTSEKAKEASTEQVDMKDLPSKILTSIQKYAQDLVAVEERLLSKIQSLEERLNAQAQQISALDANLQQVISPLKVSPETK